MKNISIVRTVILFFVISIICVASTISVSNFFISRSILRDNTQLTSKQTLQESQNGFITYLKLLSQQVDLLTRKNELKRLENEDPEIMKANLKSAKDTLIAALKTAPGAVRCYFATETNLLISAYPYLEGDTTKYQFTLEENIDSKNKEWYQNGLYNENRLGVYAGYTEPYLSELDDIEIITVSQTVKTNDGLVGVVAIDFSFEEVCNFVDDIELLNTGAVYLVNPEGHILVAPSDSPLNVTNFAELEVWEQLNTNESASIETKMGNQYYYLTSFTNPITDWKLIGIVNENELTSNLFKIITYNIPMMIGVIILGILVTLPIVKGIKVRFAMLRRSIDEVAQGNFVEQPVIDGRDEFHTLSLKINEMIASVANLITNVEQTARTLFIATNQITGIANYTQEASTNVKAAIEEISAGTAHQAQSLQDISKQVEALATQLDETRNYTSDVKQMSSETQIMSTSGLNMLSTLNEASQHSQATSMTTYNCFKAMTESIEKIHFISDTIISITDQTSLLSLNASIEAARAGESGRGFAVVADEIRKLADASKKSTDEIKAIVDEIYRTATQANNSLEESNAILIEQGTAIANTESVFNNILVSVEKLIENIYEIDKLNNNMVESKNSVIRNMDEMAAISEETASSAEEVTASTTEVSSSMEELTNYTSELTKAADALKAELKHFKLK